MILRSIDILNFKNIAEARLDFSARVNCLLGLNGMGKSNLLEAIHLLCMARPIRSVPESALVRHGQEMMMVKGEYVMENGSAERVCCGFRKGKGKSLRRNDKEYRRISEHIGNFPVVSVTPSDTEIVSDSAETRRRLMDIVISQANPPYLSQLIRYNRALDSRNKMLRAGVNDRLLYESIEINMAEAARAINLARASWVEAMQPDFNRYYRLISDDAEQASISYKSVLNNMPMQEVFDSERARDLALGFTSQGVHRDDLIMRLGEYQMRRMGSQGQIKSFTIALKLAIFDFLRDAAGEKPILLLDDIFDKLDSCRVARIIDEVSAANNFGQLFITDTNREHIDEILAHLHSDTGLFEVRDGMFNRLSQSAL